MSLPIRCINPRCPSLRAPNNGWFKNEHALHIHLGRTPECREYWAAADNDADQPPHPQTSPPVPIQPPFFESTTPSGEHEEDKQMESEDSGSHAPSEPSFHILDYPGAALRYTDRVGTEWERRKAREGPDRCYGPFADADEYGLVKWAVESSQSLAAINGLLRTEYVLNHPRRLSFASADAMRALIESEAFPAPPRWKSAQIILNELPSQPQTLYYRDIHEAIDYLFGNPTFAGSMDYAPRRIFDGTGKRVFHEFYTGDGWWDAQASVRVRCCSRTQLSHQIL
ncbi:hypothetical protein M407DRAFT_10698 [Tulasnella calospora MUT 4182]|uniref:Uncharacterized protein n=1 Tax=Tulasnella calospora MUT 4182 TaxID=1051891 RepID=A0A0C3QA05_9AGAM|nr:hypothetical protein M407DRAFT_10698 [Tulasnella calospora MUT 4182]